MRRSREGAILVTRSHPFLLPPEITFIRATTNGLVDKAALMLAAAFFSWAQKRERKGGMYRGIAFDTPGANDLEWGV